MNSANKMMIGSGTPSSHNSAPRPKPITASNDEVFIRFIPAGAIAGAALPTVTESSAK
jgi:hypothetical protein